MKYLVISAYKPRLSTPRPCARLRAEGAVASRLLSFAQRGGEFPMADGNSKGTRAGGKRKAAAAPTTASVEDLQEYDHRQIGRRSGKGRGGKEVESPVVRVSLKKKKKKKQ